MRTRLRTRLLAAAIVVLALAGAELALRRNLAPDELSLGDGCAVLQDPAADMGPVPVMVKVARGRTGSFDATVANASVGGLDTGPLSVAVADVAFRPWGGIETADVRARLTTVVGPDAVARAIATGGSAPEVTLDDGGLTVDGLLPMGLHIDVAVAGGGLRLTPRHPELAALAVEVRIPHVHVHEARTTTDGIEVAATVDGKMIDVACAARDEIERQLAPLRLLSGAATPRR